MLAFIHLILACSWCHAIRMLPPPRSVKITQVRLNPRVQFYVSEPQFGFRHTLQTLLSVYFPCTPSLLPSISLTWNLPFIGWFHHKSQTNFHKPFNCCSYLDQENFQVLNQKNAHNFAKIDQCCIWICSNIKSKKIMKNLQENLYLVSFSLSRE